MFHSISRFQDRPGLALKHFRTFWRRAQRGRATTWASKSSALRRDAKIPRSLLFICIHIFTILRILKSGLLCSSFVRLCSLPLQSLSHILADGQALAARDRACLSSTPWHDSKSSHWMPHEYSISKDCKAPKSIKIHYSSAGFVVEELDGSGS